jgi:hypothetical protein
MVSTGALGLSPRNGRTATIINVFETQAVGWRGADSGPRFGVLDEASKLGQAPMPPADLKEGSNHPPYLVSQKALTDEIEIDTVATVMNIDPEQGTDGRFRRRVGDRK